MKTFLTLIPVVAVILVYRFVPPIYQSDAYHAFAGSGTLLDVPNFWNVTSNLSFLVAAAVMAPALRSGRPFAQHWERVAYAAMTGAIVVTAFGSAYYHLHPDSRTLFWDRLPMTTVFMSVFALTIGERFDIKRGGILLGGLITVGIASVWWWKQTGDLRFYALIQFVPMLLIPAFALLWRSRYSPNAGIWWMLVFYILAKLLELFDRQIGRYIAMGGHPWKHVAAAIAVAAYGASIACRCPVPVDMDQPAVTS